jgi:anti-sigma B factor antagonist
MADTAGSHLSRCSDATRPKNVRHGIGPMVLCPVGDVDHYSAEPIRVEIQAAILGYGKGLIISLEDVGFIDSTGLGLLVGAMKRMDALSRPFHIVCTNEHMLSMFRITGLDKVFSIHTSVGQALLATVEKEHTCVLD